MPKLERMSLRTTPLWLRTSGPFEPSPGNGPAVSSGMTAQLAPAARRGGGARARGWRRAGARGATRDHEQAGGDPTEAEQLEDPTAVKGAEVVDEAPVGLVGLVVVGFLVEEGTVHQVGHGEGLIGRGVAAVPTVRGVA